MPTAAPPHGPDEHLAPGRPTRLGRYALRYRVADGGMASVYLAQLVAREGFHKWVAIKTIHPHIAREPRFVRMFLNEARLAARLDHPNICTVFDFGEADGTYYLAMEYLHGEPLVALIRREHAGGGMPREVAVRIIADTARGLHAAHELRAEDGRLAGVVHRDVSPQNIFVLYSGVTKVVDFGVARSSEHLGEKTATGELRGKLAYMSPEQTEGVGVDRRTDIWALGVVLWEATTSKRLFKRPSDVATLRAVVADAIPRPGAIRADYPAALEAIVMRALERDPERRYQTAQQLARDLEQFLAREGHATTTDEVGELMQRAFADRIAERQGLLRRENVDAPLEVLDPALLEGSASESQSAAPSRIAPRTADAVRGASDGGDGDGGGSDGDDAATVARSGSHPGATTGLASAREPSSAAQGARGRPAERPARGEEARRTRGALLLVLATAATVLVAGVSYLAFTLGRTSARDAGARSATTATSSTTSAAQAPSGPTAPPTGAADAAGAESAPLVAVAAPRAESNAPPDRDGLAAATADADAAGPTPAVAPLAADPPADSPTHARAPASTAPHRRAAPPASTAGAPSATLDASAPARGRTGTLTVLADRAFRVYLGAELLGSTPLLGRAMPVGNHTLRLVPADDGPAQTIQVEVESGATALVRLRAQ